MSAVSTAPPGPTQAPAFPGRPALRYWSRQGPRVSHGVRIRVRYYRATTAAPVEHPEASRLRVPDSARQALAQLGQQLGELPRAGADL
jgi:hypothetical protein